MEHNQIDRSDVNAAGLLLVSSTCTGNELLWNSVAQRT